LKTCHAFFPFLVVTKVPTVDGLSKAKPAMVTHLSRIGHHGPNLGLRTWSFVWYTKKDWLRRRWKVTVERSLHW